MKYGYIKTPISVAMAGQGATPEQIKWARDHKSSGRYSYHTHSVYSYDGTPSAEWYFELNEDATLFALKFK